MRLIAPWMEVFAGINLTQVMLNAALLLFWGKSHRKVPYVVGIISSGIGILASIGASIVVLLASN